MPKESNNIIPVVFSSDENYKIPLSVAIASLLKNANPCTFYHIHILVDQLFSDLAKETITSIRSSFPNCSIVFHTISEEFDNFYLLKRITSAAFFRLRIPSILSEYKKCIYLDADTIVVKDLQELYDTALTGFYLAGVKDLDATTYPTYKNLSTKECLELFGLADSSQYINSGVLIMNLEKMRNDQMEEKFIELCSNNYQHQDQDVLNVACYNKIKHLPMCYNLPATYFRMETGKLLYAPQVEMSLPEKEILFQLRNKKIIHYMWKNRPWENRNVFLGEVWWIYRKYSAFPF